MNYGDIGHYDKDEGAFLWWYDQKLNIVPVFQERPLRHNDIINHYHMKCYGRIDPKLKAISLVEMTQNKPSLLLRNELCKIFEEKYEGFQVHVYLV